LGANHGNGNKIKIPKPNGVYKPSHPSGIPAYGKRAGSETAAKKKWSVRTRPRAY